MSFSEFFARPQRVSRLYPIFTLILMLVSSSLVYAWKENQIESNSTVVAQTAQINSLESQVTSLSSQQTSDQATLLSQKQQITSSTAQLKSVQTQLASNEAALNLAQTQLKSQSSQLSQNATELQQLRSQPPLFDFKNDSDLPDISTKEAEVKQLVTDAYPEINALYGQPYLLKDVTITFVNSFSIAGSSGEIVITNGPDGVSMNIQLADFDPNNFTDVNSVLHEMIHAWHGIAVLSPSALEEGITVATTDALTENMIADGKIDDFGTYGSLYINIDDAEYQSLNQTLSVYADSATFYNDPQIAEVYQMIGKAWYTLYQQNPNFFKEFNAAYYPKVQAGETVDTAMVQDIIRSIIPSVNGVPINTYLSDNRAFNPS